jgi:hypothetical protein
MEKRLLTLSLILIPFFCGNIFSQTVLCTYKNGYYHKNGNTWREYRPKIKDGVWATYTEYKTDISFYYLKNDKGAICVPKKSTVPFYRYNYKTSKWDAGDTPIDIYYNCPNNGVQLYCYKGGVFVKSGNKWTHYEKNSTSPKTYEQYIVNDIFIYVRDVGNNTPAYCIPQSEKHRFFIYKNKKWESLGYATAIYDKWNPQAYAGNYSNPSNQKSTASTNTSKTSTSSSKSTSAQNDNYTINGHEYVDLGLSVLWATCNVGALTPEGYGEHYSWGDWNEKQYYNKPNYYYKIGLNISGTQYDVAHRKWGGSWMMPTAEQFKELMVNCTHEYTMIKGVRVLKFTGRNGKSIFFPVAGTRWKYDFYDNERIGRYWASTINSEDSYYADAFIIEYKRSGCYVSTGERYSGFSVRPVSKKISTKPAGNANSVSKNKQGSINGHNYVDLGLSVKWATCNVGASSPSGYGDYYAWGETSTKSGKYDKDTYRFYKNNKMEYIGRDISGTSNDVARQKWGGTWRMPREAEFRELIAKCTWTWTSQDGHFGFRVSRNGNSIFLPAVGFHNYSEMSNVNKSGNYWSSTGGYQEATLLKIYENGPVIYDFYRELGFCIRPVSE